MIDLPDTSTFAAVVSDGRIWAAIAVALISGVVRGFSGFGSALIYIPLMSAIYDPRIAAATFLLIDFTTGIALALSVWRVAYWREVLPLAAAAVLSTQLGTLILQHADPTALRWGISIVVGMVVVVLASGWRYHGQPRLAVTVAVGLMAGIIGGAAQMSGPPIIVYWLGSMHEAAVLRANFATYFSLFAAGSMVTYLVHGLLTAAVIALALILGPLHFIAIWLGARFFHLASDTTYRRIAYVIIAVAAIVAMPLLDRLVR